MGCHVSRLDSGLARPLLLQRLEEMRSRGRALKGPTPSKKELLSHADEESASQHLFPSPNPKPDEDNCIKKPVQPEEIGTIGNNVAKDRGSIGKNEAMIEDDDLEEDDDNDERMIGYEDDEAFPGSPSFRVYFKEDDEVDSHLYNGEDDAFKETDGVPPKESSVEKKVKRSKKKRSFRKVLPKNLLNVKSCYTSPRHNNHLRPAKTTT